MVLPFPTRKHGAALIHGACRQYVASQCLARAARELLPLPQIAREQLHFFKVFCHRSFFFVAFFMLVLTGSKPIERRSLEVSVWVLPALECLPANRRLDS